VAINENVVDVTLISNIAKHNMEKNSKYDKLRFDRNKATIVKHKVKEHVLLKNKERHQKRRGLPQIMTRRLWMKMMLTEPVRAAMLYEIRKCK